MSQAAQQATSTIPIVPAGSGDPVGVGLVASIRRPGGNITGVAVRNPEAPSKNLELLIDVVPTLTRVGVMLNPNNASSRLGLATIAELGAQRGLEVQAPYVREPDDLDEAFEQEDMRHPAHAADRKAAALAVLHTVSPRRSGVLISPRS
jgi:putative ABC transport system substrate-binding protein